MSLLMSMVMVSLYSFSGSLLVEGFSLATAPSLSPADAVDVAGCADGSAHATKHMASAMIKAARDKKEYGTMATTFVFHGGKIKEMIIQTNFKKMY